MDDYNQPTWESWLDQLSIKTVQLPRCQIETLIFMFNDGLDKYMWEWITTIVH